MSVPPIFWYASLMMLSAFEPPIRDRFVNTGKILTRDHSVTRVATYLV